MAANASHPILGNPDVVQSTLAKGGIKTEIVTSEGKTLWPKYRARNPDNRPEAKLNVSVQAEVLNLLTRLQRERALTYILVSHNLAVVGHMCEGLAVMQHGQVVETMTVAQLRENAPTHPYTKRLLLASRGYDRSALESLEEETP